MVFTLRPRTQMNTWIASPEEQSLIDAFLNRYPTERSARYREILLRIDARLEMPHDAEGQKMLDAIYAARRRAQKADVEMDRLHPGDR